MTTETLYIVWRSSPDRCWRIWLPAHFAAAGVRRPGPSDPDVVYWGSAYADALRAADQANRQDGRWPMACPDVARASRPCSAPIPEPTSKPVQLSLFQEVAS